MISQVIKGLMILLLLTVSVGAQTKGGCVSVRSNVPIEISITDVGLVEVFKSKGPVLEWTECFSPGVYAVSFKLPDGTIRDQIISVKKDCKTGLDLSYRPPLCPSPVATNVPELRETPEPKSEPTPEFEFKPQPVPTLFDKCCGCKRDDLKARLDLFAIELHRNPSVRGIVAPPFVGSHALSRESARRGPLTVGNAAWSRRVH